MVAAWEDFLMLSIAVVVWLPEGFAVEEEDTPGREGADLPTVEDGASGLDLPDAPILDAGLMALDMVFFRWMV